MNTARKLEPEHRRAVVLIVDDEVSIRRSLEGALREEGFETVQAPDGETALGLIQTARPSLVLLDIWMPGIDGVETLKLIKARYPDLPVVMMSGHATIATAVMATHHGAADFIEKPLDLNATFESIRRAISGGIPQSILQNEGEREIRGADNSTARQRTAHLDSSVAEVDSEELLADGAPRQLHLNRIVFDAQTLRGERVQQRTLARSAILYGQGLHSGKKSGLILEPLPANSGIHFMGVTAREVVPAHVNFVDSTGFATTLKLGATQVGTIEHLMSALHAYGISNLLIKCNGEVPVMDGSSRDFCTLLEDTGFEAQEGDWYEIAVREPIQVGGGSEFIRLEPADDFTIDYTLDYPAPLGRQRYVFTLSSVENYKKEISTSRTFGFVRDISALQKQGLALGGRFDNFVLFGADKAINTELRFPDEPVRHKVLDAIGDLYLLGRKIRGKVTACMTGHSDNVALLRALIEQMRK